MSDPEHQAFTTRDLAIAALLGLIVLIASQAPTLWGFWAQKQALHPDLVFNGSAFTYADESATYWSWMRQARDGRFFLTDLYTTEDHPRNYVNLLWWGLGAICRLTGWSVVAVYSGSRVILGALLIALLFRLATRLFTTRGERLSCFIVLLLAGGWEGLFRTLGPLPGVPRLGSPAWWMPEISTFFSLMLFPHFLAGFICVVAGTLAMIAGWSALSQAERDAAYNNNLAVANSAELIERRNAASAAFRKAHPAGLDVAYGPALLATARLLL